MTLLTAKKIKNLYLYGQINTLTHHFDRLRATVSASDIAHVKLNMPDFM